LSEPPFFSNTENKGKTVSGRITVYVDDKQLSLYRGMSVRHALTLEQIRMVESGSAEVRNSYGHVVGLDGALSDGQRLTFHGKNKEGTCFSKLQDTKKDK